MPLTLSQGLGLLTFSCYGLELLTFSCYAHAAGIRKNLKPTTQYYK